MVKDEKIYNLKHRTQQFGFECIKLVKSISFNPITNPLITQLVKSSTSIGANYQEADGAESTKDFYHKIGISLKEAKESTHWLLMLDAAVRDKKSQIEDLIKESTELSLIFGSIIRKKST